MPNLSIWKNGKELQVAFTGTPFLKDVLREVGLAPVQPCGGIGICGKCEVAVTGQVSPSSLAEIRHGCRLACQVVLLGDSQVSLPDSEQLAQIQTEGRAQIHSLHPMAGQVGAAVDLGTTTIALRLYDLRDGHLLAEAAQANPQRSVAADVMGRIGAAIAGESQRLQAMAQGSIRTLLQTACKIAGFAETQVKSMVITGNTTMLHLLTGRDPSSLSSAPFEAEHLFGEWTRLLDRDVYLPPCMNAFVGADISCAVLASGLSERPETAMLVDIGTNGEIALWKGQRLLVASTAAGPAFEGAGIYMGCSSIRGAIDRVWQEGGQLKAHTIADAAPVGICGSGLVDAIATLLELGHVDEAGAMASRSTAIAGEVILIQEDVRAIQLAKAALAAGIHTILQASSTSPTDISAFHIAGGFGSHLSINNAVRIGLIPSELSRKVRIVGNAALDGAAVLLLNQNTMDAIQRITSQSSLITLSGHAVFSRLFVEEMMFPEGS